MSIKDAGRVVRQGGRNPEENFSRLELKVDGLDKGEDERRAHHNVRELFRASPTELAVFAISDRMRKPSPSRPCIGEGPNNKAREMGGRTCTEGFKERLNESERHMEIFKIL